MSEVAYKSTDAEVLAAWDAFLVEREQIAEKRRALSERYDGRGVMVSRVGFGHDTRVVGLEQRADDEDGQVIGENGELRVPKKGPPYRTIVPNIRRKAGKDLAAELDGVTLRGPDLPGVPSFALVGLHALSPTLALREGAVYALWSEDIGDNATGGELDAGRWSPIRLSEYYAATEDEVAS